MNATHGGRSITTSSAESLADLEREWQMLGEASDNVFATWEWLSTWWSHFGRGRELRLTTCRADDGSMLAILPLYVSTRRPARTLRWMGHGPSDQLGPICRPGDRAMAVDALATKLGDDDDWDLWIGDDMPSDVDWQAATAGKRLARQASPVVPLDGCWDDWVSRQSRNLRRELGKTTRRLERQGNVTYRCTTDSEQLEADLDTLEQLHDARWHAAGGSRGFRGREAFHRAFAAIALDRGWLRLRFLELDGRAVGALYDLRFGGVEYSYQAGRRPEVAEYSVGTLLLLHSIREAFEDGLREFRLLRGAEAYKWRFTSHDFALESIATTNSVIGRGALATIARMNRYPRWARLRVPAALAWGTGATPIWGPP